MWSKGTQIGNRMVRFTHKTNQLQRSHPLIPDHMVKTSNCMKQCLIQIPEKVWGVSSWLGIEKFP